MLNQANREKCRRVLNRFGYRPQMMMVIEECSELQKATCKLLRKSTPATLTNDDTPPLRNFREEIVDVIVMVTQAVMMSGMSTEEINRRAQEKLDRTLAK